MLAMCLMYFIGNLGVNTGEKILIQATVKAFLCYILHVIVRGGGAGRPHLDPFWPESGQSDPGFGLLGPG